MRPLDLHVKDLYRVLEWHTCKSLRNYHELLLFWSINHWKKPKNLSLMFERHQERLDRLETVSYVRTERGGYERVVTRSNTQQNIQRSHENASRNSQRAESFVPRMVKKFNSLDQEYKELPAVMIHGRHSNEVERFEELKVKLKQMCMWEELGVPSTWPENLQAAMLDRGEEIYGGLNMTSTDDDESEPADP